MPTAVITVTGTGDSTIGDGTCTLREALEAINAGSTFNYPDVAANINGPLGGGDTIDLNGVSGIITLNSTLELKEDTTINGPGAGLLAIDGQNSVRLFGHLNTTALNVSINGLTLQHGKADKGGAIYFGSGHLTVSSCSVLRNSATLDGGAIAGYAGNIQVGSSTFSLSQALRSGGAIYSETATTITESRFQGNDAQFGGSVEVATQAGQLTMSQCYVDHFGPLAEEGGGVRLRNVSATQKTMIQDVIFSEAYVKLRGGGLAIVGSGDIEVLGTGVPILGTGIKATFESGGALEPGGMGGAIYIGALLGQSPTVQISGYNIGEHLFKGGDGNFADYGGNIAIVDASSVITIDNCDINHGGLHTGAPATIVGGNIYVTGNGGGSVILNNNQIRTAQASLGGGLAVMDSDISLSVDKCTITSNVALDSGGGVYLENATGDITFDRCTFGDNTAAISGGGICVVYQPHGHATITQCTIFGNEARRGGGVYGQGADSAWLTINNSTIAGNTAQGGDSTSVNTESQGGGVWFDDFDTFELESTIVATNVALTGIDPAFFTPITHGADIECSEDASGVLTAHRSLIGVDQGFTHEVDWATSFNLTGTVALPLDPQLGPLQNNGGPTQTMAIKSNSPAINAGNNSLSLTTDQRGKPRVFGGQADIGSYENNPATVTSRVFDDGTGQTTIGVVGSVQRSMVRRMIVTFSESVQFAGSVASAFKLSRTGASVSSPTFNGDVTLNAIPPTGATTAVTITFSGIFTDESFTLGNAFSLVDGMYDLVIDASQISNADDTLAGNGTTAGSNYEIHSSYDTVTLSPVPGGIWRIFGDADGNGVVTQSDFNKFRNAFGSTGNPFFDYDGDGAVEQIVDYTEFRNRFGGTP